ncbi:plasmid replication protein, CyRepA1 family [Brasilonema sp. UFV-L1]|uniref:plasmid replication protein, CyRepA1 family n=1 Tax=Brasilonema sp. UFV-L1 TaxID=2234130 RepID=UPI00145D5157|nr:plasmid replication protein, CyRepA1 family [Brasilonema sp. UFV-L1]NMG09743.1 hypothetical protein [Brasilonema sp. UFV-L1]
MFKPFGKTNPCPVCGSNNSACRYSTDDVNFIQCHTNASARKLERINGYICVKEAAGHTASFKLDNSQGSEKHQVDWEAKRQAREKRKEQQTHKSETLSIAERDKATRQLHKYFGLSTKHRQNLRERGLTDSQIDAGYFFSVAPGDDLPFGVPENYPGAKDGKLLVAGTGFACPTWTVDGLISGWQVRLDNETEGRYRWAKGNSSSHLPNGELPITVIRPTEVRHKFVADIEGILKPYITAQKFGIVCLGASGGNITSSPEQLKDTIAKLNITEILDFPDAGDVRNRNVMQRRVAKYEFYHSLGLQVRVVWWGQITKNGRDIDELEALNGITILTVEEFLAIARLCGGLEAIKPQFPQPKLEQHLDSEETQAFYTKRSEEQEQWELTCDRAVAEQKVQWLAQYPERVKRTQEALKSLAPWKPIIQDTEFVSLLVDEFLQKESPKEAGELLAGSRGETSTNKYVDMKLDGSVQGTFSFFDSFFPPSIVQSAPLQSAPPPGLVNPEIETRPLTKLIPGIYGLKVNMGGGKTFLMKQIIKQFPSGNFISFRNSIITQTCYDPEVVNIILYLWDLEKNDGRTDFEQRRDWKKAQEGWMAGCVESIAKFRPKDVLILEEVEQIKNSLLTSATCRRGRRERLREFKHRLERAKYIFLCDADLSGSTLKWLESLVPDKKINVIENVTKRFEWQCLFYTGADEILPSGDVKRHPNKRADFEYDLLSKVAKGEKLLIPTDSQRWGETIEKAILMVNPAAKGIRVDSTTKSSDDPSVRAEVDAFLANPNKWIKKNKPDYVIYSPTCEASLDITVQDYFGFVFGCFVHANFLSCKQLLGRLRTNAPRHIFAKTHVAFDDGASKSPMPEVLAKHMFQHNFETLREVTLAEYPEIKNDFDLIRKLNELIDFESGEYKNPHVQALVEIKAQENYSRSDLRKLLAEELERCGHIITWLEPGEATPNPSTPHRKEVIKEWAEAIANAEDITIEQARSIQQSMDSYMGDRHKATKAILQHRLPGYTLTPDFIAEHYLEDRSWISCQELRYLLDHPEMAKAFDRESWMSVIKHDTAWWDIRTDSLKIKALTVLGIPEIAKSGKEWHKDTDWLLDFKKLAIKHSKLLLLALGVTANKSSDPCYLLRRCLEKAGYPVIGKQRRVAKGSDERIRAYWVDPAVLASDGSLYHDIYQAIGKRFTEKLAKLDSASHHVPLDISLRAVGDNQEVDGVDGLSLSKVEEEPVLSEFEILIAKLESCQTQECLLDLQNQYSRELVLKAVDCLTLVSMKRVCDLMGRRIDMNYWDVS